MMTQFGLHAQIVLLLWLPAQIILLLLLYAQVVFLLLRGVWCERLPSTADKSMILSGREMNGAVVEGECKNNMGDGNGEN